MSDIKPSERDTMPPGSFSTPTEPPPGLYADSVVNDLLRTAQRLEAHYKELLDPAGILERHRVQIAQLIDANYGLIHEHVKSMGETLRVVHGQVNQHATRFDSVDTEIASIKRRLDALEAWRESVNQ